MKYNCGDVKHGDHQRYLFGHFEETTMSYFIIPAGFAINNILMS